MPRAQAPLLVKANLLNLLSSVVQKEKAVVIPARAERERIEKAVRDVVERPKGRMPSKGEKPQVRMLNGKQHVVTEFTNATGESASWPARTPPRMTTSSACISRESSKPPVSSFASTRKNRVARNKKKPGVRPTSSTYFNPTRPS